MQNTAEFRKLAGIVEYWNPVMKEHTKLLVGRITKKTLLIVVDQNEAAEITKLEIPMAGLFTLEHAKEGKLPAAKPDFPVMLTPLAIQQMMIEMSGLGLWNGDQSKHEVYQALLTNGMIKPQFQKQVYMKIKEIEERI